MKQLQRRFIWVFTIVVGCTLLLWIPQSAQGQQNSEFIYLPVFENNEAVAGQTEPAAPVVSNLVTVRGTMVSTGVPFDTVLFHLWRYNPAVANSAELVNILETRLTTTTNEVNYHFDDQPRLEPGYLYSVVYLNSAQAPGLLYVWYTSGSGNPTTGADIILPTFDIADITLTNPAAGATPSLPEDFRWNARTTATDLYRLQFYETNADGDIVRNAETDELPHPASSFFVGNINEVTGFQTDVEYRWRILVYDGLGGKGSSLERRAITFRELQAAQAAANSLSNSLSKPSAPTIFDRSSWLESDPPVDFSRMMDEFYSERD